MSAVDKAALSGSGGPVLHLMKLAVGSQTLEDLAAWQAEVVRRNGRLLHRTRQCPRRRSELLSGGSIYWVIRGRILARQLLKGIEQLEVAEPESDRRTTLLLLDGPLIPTEAKVQRAFQGWRYLLPQNAPADLPQGCAGGGEDLAAPSAEMLAELRQLGLL